MRIGVGGVRRRQNHVMPCGGGVGRADVGPYRVGNGIGGHRCAHRQPERRQAASSRKRVAARVGENFRAVIGAQRHVSPICSHATVLAATVVDMGQHGVPDNIGRARPGRRQGNTRRAAKANGHRATQAEALDDGLFTGAQVDGARGHHARCVDECLGPVADAAVGLRHAQRRSNPRGTPELHTGSHAARIGDDRRQILSGEPDVAASDGAHSAAIADHRQRAVRDGIAGARAGRTDADATAAAAASQRAAPGHRRDGGGFGGGQGDVALRRGDGGAVDKGLRGIGNVIGGGRDPDRASGAAARDSNPQCARDRQHFGGICRRKRNIAVGEDTITIGQAVPDEARNGVSCSIAGTRSRATAGKPASTDAYGQTESPDLDRRSLARGNADTAVRVHPGMVDIGRYGVLDRIGGHGRAQCPGRRRPKRHAGATRVGTNRRSVSGVQMHAVAPGTCGVQIGHIQQVGFAGIADVVDRYRSAQCKTGIATHARTCHGDVVHRALISSAHLDLTGNDAARDLLDRGPH